MATSTLLLCLYALALLLLASLLGCATMDQACKQRVSQCVQRCETSNPDSSPSRAANFPANTLSDCESRCGNCAPVFEAPAQPPSTGSVPTLTGNAL